ncbi:inner nuclear membrane protein enriched at telomere/subtelomere region [Paramarasmius palmivorus]|uniref:Inner nuclear membrane protein enriched at telomere/subtelomere region n=1 Tax=Paramarasmius palmivorus TaxID=297713 RepID=A0AAW0DQB4_9AGAR
MSRLSAAQVIALGEYLEPDFDPATLTISQLLGILGFHNIVYPTPYSKPKLVQLFNDEVKRRASKFKKERLKKENSIASDDGITDGLTGEPLNKRKARCPSHTAVRRSSRRLSKAPEEEQDPSPPRPEPPKRRRSSAAPRLGGPSKQAPPLVEPAVQEESEPEEELPVRKVGRTKKSADAAMANRRISQADDSGWEDNNIFQSGAESSSPARPSPVKPKARRSSAAPRKSRKSMSAPPASPPKSTYQPPPLSPPQSNFEPELPAFTKFRTPASSRKSGRPSFPSNFSPSPPKSIQQPVIIEDTPPPEEPAEQLQVLEEAPEEDPAPEEEEAEEDDEETQAPDVDQVIAVQKRIAEGGRVITPPSVDDAFIDEVKPVPLLLRFVYLLVLSALSYAAYEYKVESASIGYCDPGSNTNAVLEQLRATRAAVEACNAQNRTLLYEGDSESTPCPLPSLWPAVALPDSCTPCPEHAICSGHAIACEKPYILKSPLVLSFLPPVTDPTSINLSTALKPEEMAWKVISVLTDGLPGFGSVGVVPSCEEDPRRKRHIGALGKAIELALAQERGTRLCYGERERDVKDADGGEARRWGLPLSELRAKFKPSEDSSHASPNYDDIFQEAVQQLAQWGGMLISEDSKGERYLAHKSPMLTWDCRLKVKSREVWAEWRMTVFGIFALIALYYTSRHRRVKQKAERVRVAGLVQVALETLRHQEMAHHIDPVSVPQPYLSSLQLRDLVLQEEHSVPARARLWDKVEKVVEGNANVRTNMEEVSGGDEMRVWRWVGTTSGPATPMKLGYGTVSYAEQDESIHQ